MNSQHDPMDDIIELTDIVEEGSPAETDFTDLDDFAMDRAVDAESLDQELDDLLREEPSAPEPAADETPGADLEDLFGDAPGEKPAAGKNMQQSDLSDLDDLFDSLQFDEPDEQNSLDMLLDEKSLSAGQQEASGPAEEDTIDLDLEIPDLQPADSEPDLLELTDDLLADIPDTVLASPAQPAEPTGPASSSLFIPESPEPALELVTPADQSAPIPEPPAEEPVEALPYEPPVETAAEPVDIAQSHLEILSSRIDALEARPEPALEISPEQVLAALPGSPEALPLAQALREEILQTVDAKLSGLPVTSELDEVRQLAAAAAARLDALEAAPEVEISTEQVLAALPDSPEALPLAQALREEILQAVEGKLSALPAAPELDEIRQRAAAADARLDALESAPAPEVGISAEQVLAALPGSPEELPLAQVLREEILQAVEEKLSGHPSAPELDEIRQLAAAAAARLDALENAPAPEVGISAEQVLAALPGSAEELPLTQALRSELLERIDAGLSTRASTEAVEELRRHMETAQEQLDAMPETLARLAASTTPALQELEHGVSSLGTLVQELRQGLDGMKEALADKDAAIAAMREEAEMMREEIDALNARLDTQPDATALKNEMEEHVRQQVPATVARVIRKEIQALLKEMES